MKKISFSEGSAVVLIDQKVHLRGVLGTTMKNKLQVVYIFVQLDSMNLWNYCHDNLSSTRISMDKVSLGIFHLMKNYQKHFMHHYSTKNFNETLKNAAKPLFLHSPRFAQYSYLSTQITGLSSGFKGGTFYTGGLISSNFE